MMEKTLQHGDVAHTINLLMNAESESTYRDNLKNVSNVQVMNEKDIMINLKEQDSYFTSKLTFPILKQNFIKISANDANLLNGTGPYKYQEETESSIVLAANENWWKETDTKLKKIYLKKYATYSEAVKGFKSAEIDMILTNMYDWKEKFGFIGINSYKFENTEYELLIPNTENKILSDNAVRKAILYGINRPNIVSTIYDENAVISDIPIMSSSKHFKQNAEYNIETARQILMNGAWKLENNQWKKNGTVLKFTILVNKDDKEKVSVAEKIKLDLAEININVTIKEVTFDSLKTSIQNDKFEMALVSIDVKNEYQIQDLVTMGNEYNYANYINVELDEILKKLKSTNEEEYDQIFSEFQDIYKNELPYIGLYFKTNTILTNKSVKGEYKSTFYEPYKNIYKFYK